MKKKDEKTSQSEDEKVNEMKLVGQSCCEKYPKDDTEPRKRPVYFDVGRLQER